MRVLSTFFAAGLFASGISDVAGTCTCSKEAASSWKCGTDVYYCPGLEEMCGQSMNGGDTMIELTDAQCADMRTKNIGGSCPLGKSISHRVCYGETVDCKFDGSNEQCTDNLKLEEPQVEVLPAVGCPETVFDFSGLANGAYLHDQFWDSKCVKVTAFANLDKNSNRAGFTPINGVHAASGGAARIFDTGVASNCDEDLMTPSPKFYDGPDVSCADCCGGGPFLMYKSGGQCVLKGGVEQANPYKNDKYLGNVLIIQEKYNIANEMQSCPDDTGSGGYILFEFCEPVTFNTGSLLDVDAAESAKIEFYYDGVAQPETFKVPMVGDNGYWGKGTFDEENVVKVKFVFTGSGCIEGVSYTKSTCPEITPSPTPNPTKNPTPNPTKNPTPNPTPNPTKNPTPGPTPVPTKNPTPGPTP
jgi:hypothetical protein